MPRPRSLDLLVGATLLAVVVTADVRSARAGDEAWQLERTTVHPGVEVTRMLRAQPPLVVHAVRVSSDAPVELRPVVASEAIGDEAAGRGHETTSSMCGRAAGLVCVNADFNACPGCREPFGGVVLDGRVLRSFNVGHEQLSVGARGPTTERIEWSGVLRASYSWHQRDNVIAGLPLASTRSSTSSVDLSGLNVRMGDGQVVAYTREWAPTAPAPVGAKHLSLLLSRPLVPGSISVVDAQWTNMSPIPADAVVIVASGPAAERLDRFWGEWSTIDADQRALVIETATSQPLETSVGGHPVLLRGGQVADLDQSDPKVRDRHPRTLAGWTTTGDLFLLTVDGRQGGYSQGITLAEAQQLLLSLGAADGINLDGGGSSTFVTQCDSGRCVRNRPSDGRERRVTMALAVVAGQRPAATAVPAPAPPALAVPPAPAAEPSDPALEPAAAPPPPPPVAATSPAPPVPPPVATPTTDVAPDGLSAAPAPAPADTYAGASSTSPAVLAPAPHSGNPLPPPLVPLKAAALGLWLTTASCAAATASPRAVAVPAPRRRGPAGRGRACVVRRKADQSRS